MNNKMSLKYDGLSDEEIIEEIRRRIIKIKELLKEIREIFKEMG